MPASVSTTLAGPVRGTISWQDQGEVLDTVPDVVPPDTVRAVWSTSQQISEGHLIGQQDPECTLLFLRNTRFGSSKYRVLWVRRVRSWA